MKGLKIAMIKLSKEILDLLLICIEKNLQEYEFVSARGGLVPIENPIQYRENIIEKILNPSYEDYTMDFYNTLRSIVGDEFNGPGLGADFEPNEYGLKLDRLISELGSLVHLAE